MIIEINRQQMEEAEQRLAHIKNGAALALSRALNKTVAKSRTLASTEIRKQIRLKASKVREKLRIVKANRNQLTAALQADRRGLLMYNYVTNYANARKGRPATPIKVKVKPDGKTYILPHSFYILTATSNILTPAHRVGGRIEVMHSPSVSQVLSTVKDDISPEMNTTLATNLQHEMDWLLTKHPPPSGDGTDEQP